MIGSEKQISWALSIRNKVVSIIVNNPDEFPLCEEMAELYRGIEDASWWINNRQRLASRQYILVLGLVSVMEHMGLSEACDEIIRLQDDIVLAPLFDEFKVNNDQDAW